MATLDVTEIDLAALADRLGEAFRGSAPVGAIVGRTLIRDAVAQMLVCSDLEAEQIVDTMVARGFLVLEGEPQQDVPAAWRFHGTELTR